MLIHLNTYSFTYSLIYLPNSFLTRSLTYSLTPLLTRYHAQGRYPAGAWYCLSSAGVCDGDALQRRPWIGRGGAAACGCVSRWRRSPSRPWTRRRAPNPSPLRPSTQPGAAAAATPTGGQGCLARMPCSWGLWAAGVGQKLWTKHLFIVSEICLKFTFNLEAILKFGIDFETILYLF